MAEKSTPPKEQKTREKELETLRRRVQRAEDQLQNYEQLVDRTQHMLNTRIKEVEAARTELRARTYDLERSERRFRQLADAAFEAIVIHIDGRIADCNDAAVELYGLSKEELVGKRVIDLVDSFPADNGDDWTRHPTDEPIEATHKRGSRRVPVEIRSRAIEMKGEAALVTVIRDITAHKRMQEYLREMAYSDVLTCVANRRFFIEQGKKEVGRSLRHHLPLSLLMMDIDYFKHINDTYGHEVGDMALKALANLCCQSVREEDLFARLGGEEFAVILPNTPVEEALNLAERLRRKIEEMVTPTPKGEIRFTVSMGVTQLYEGDEDEAIDRLLNRADKGLYKAKALGKNRVVLF